MGRWPQTFLPLHRLPSPLPARAQAAFAVALLLPCAPSHRHPPCRPVLTLCGHRRRARLHTRASPSPLSKPAHVALLPHAAASGISTNNQQQPVAPEASASGTRGHDTGTNPHCYTSEALVPADGIGTNLTQFLYEATAFILRARVLSLYREALRTARRAPPHARAELRQSIREELGKNQQCHDRQKIRFLISEGRQRLKDLKEMLDMQGHA